MNLSRRSVRPFIFLVLLGAAGTGPHGGQVDYRMVPHPVSGVELPRISLSERPAVEQAVNEFLESTAARVLYPSTENLLYPSYAPPVVAASAASSSDSSCRATSSRRACRLRSRPTFRSRSPAANRSTWPR